MSCKKKKKDNTILTDLPYELYSEIASYIPTVEEYKIFESLCKDIKYGLSVYKIDLNKKITRFLIMENSALGSVWHVSLRS